MALHGLIGQSKSDTGARDKDGCSHGGASQGRLNRSERAQIYAGGKGILNEDQFAKFKAECKKGEKEKTQT
jgi:hypothetical protein